MGTRIEECRLIKECAFYGGLLDGVQGPSAYLKEVFCHGRPGACARLQRSEVSPVSDPQNPSTPLWYGSQPELPELPELRAD